MDFAEQMAKGSVTENLNATDKFAIYKEEIIHGEPYSVQENKRPTDVEYDPPQRLTSERHLAEIYSRGEDYNWSKLCSKIEKGDMRNSLLTFLTACVGAGILSFPQIFSFYGIFLSILISLLFCYLNYETYHIIDKAILTTGRRGFGNICSYFFGHSIAKFLNVGMMSVMFMISCVYASITWNFFEKLITDYDIVSFPLKNANTGEFDEYDSKTILWRFTSMTVICILCFPLLLFRKLTALRFVTAGIMLVIGYIFVLTVIQTPAFFAHYRNKDSYQLDWLPPPISLDWISGIGALSMSYSAQPIYIYIRAEMIHKSLARTSRVYTGGLFIEFLLYSIFGLCGYISVGQNNVPTIFTQRKSVFGNDTFMAIARLMFFPLICLHVLLPFITLRESILQFFKVEKTQKNITILTACLSVLVFMLPVVYPDVLSLMGIFGGLFSGFIGCVTLFLIGIKLAKSQLTKTKYFIFATIFIWSALANTYNSLVGIFVH
jgi:amino acid permease